MDDFIDADGTTRSQGVHGSGRTTYTPWEYVAIVQYLQKQPPMEERTVLVITDLFKDLFQSPPSFGGNTIRKIVHDAEDVGDLLLGGTGADGYRIAQSPEDAQLYSAHLRLQVKSVQTRIRQRERFIKRWFEKRKPLSEDPGAPPDV